MSIQGPSDALVVDLETGSRCLIPPESVGGPRPAWSWFRGSLRGLEDGQSVTRVRVLHRVKRVTPGGVFLGPGTVKALLGENTQRRVLNVLQQTFC